MRFLANFFTQIWIKNHLQVIISEVSLIYHAFEIVTIIIILLLYSMLLRKRKERSLDYWKLSSSK